MRRLFYLLPVAVVASLLILLTARPTVAQPPGEGPQQGDEPISTPPPQKGPVDWANVRMEGEGEGDFPHAETREPQTPPAPEESAPEPAPLPEDDAPPPGGEAPPAEGTAPAPAPGETTYVVRAGDTLYEIAQQFDVSLSQLIAANDVPNPRRLDIGQVLVIPGAGAAAEGAAPSGEPAQDSSAPVGAQTYIVQRGDTPYRIARRFGVELEALIAVNQISDPRRLAVGQVLTIPAPGQPAVAAAPPASAPAAPAAPAAGQEGDTVYVVRRGDTLQRIARSYNVSMQSLVDANRLASPDRIMAGQKLTIPGTTAKNPPESAPAAQAQETPTPPPTQPPPEPTAEATTPPAGDGPFIWPIPLQDGWIPQGYSGWHPGVDIILPTGTPIQAAARGTIEFSGWNGYGFGNLVVIDHGNGYRTLYAHQSERLVATGDTVAQGDVIGLVGSTGRSTHPHLHFEIRQNYAPVNPCAHLPGGCQ